MIDQLDRIIGKKRGQHKIRNNEVEFIPRDNFKIQLFSDQIHQSEFKKDQTNDTQSQKFGSYPVDQHNERNHHHEHDAQEKIKLYNDNFIQMKNKFPE